jgi:hypothetical protein
VAIAKESHKKSLCSCFWSLIIICIVQS